MEFWIKVLQLLDLKMTTPSCYSLFHIAFFATSIITAACLCVFRKHDSADRVRKVVFWLSMVVVALEIYKLINFSFSYTDGTIEFDFPWYAFPFQFCSTPMYAGVLAGLIKRGKVHDALCAYLATYAIFAGLCVMVYPGDVFVPTIGINIQTMICHGIMLPIGAYLFATGHVKLAHKTILKALCVFAATVGVAIVLNEIAYITGLLETDTFNMFYISPHCDPHLPVYSTVQELIPYPLSLVFYIAGFTAAAFLVLLASMGIHRLFTRRKAPEAAGICK